MLITVGQPVICQLVGQGHEGEVGTALGRHPLVGDRHGASERLASLLRGRDLGKYNVAVTLAQ